MRNTWPGGMTTSMRTMGNEVNDGRLRRWRSQQSRSGLDGCQPGCCTFVLHRFHLLGFTAPEIAGAKRRRLGESVRPRGLGPRVDHEVSRSPRRCGRYLTQYLVAKFQALVAGSRVTRRCHGRDLMATLPAEAALFSSGLITHLLDRGDRRAGHLAGSGHHCVRAVASGIRCKGTGAVPVHGDVRRWR
jgi:hypothetical protein